LACAVLAATVSARSGRPGAGVVAGLALGTSRIFWEYALVVEVFALNALMAALLLFFMVRFLNGLEGQRPVLWPLPASALVMSTCVTHHLTLTLVALPVLAMYGACMPVLARLDLEPSALRRATALSAVAVLAGTLPLLYIPIAARFDPVLNWGNPRDV